MERTVEHTIEKVTEKVKRLANKFADAYQSWYDQQKEVSRLEISLDDAKKLMNHRHSEWEAAKIELNEVIEARLEDSKRKL